jgi:hypothetical protein
MIKKGARGLADFVRIPRSEEVSSKEIGRSESWVEDTHFTKLYQRYSLGKLLGVATRGPIARILPGVYRLSSEDRVEHIACESATDAINAMTYDIRCGHRPSLFLYKGIFGESKNHFVCSDDLTAYYAYKNLGICRVPAIILGKHKDLLSESGICTRGDPRKLGSFVYDSVLALSPNSAQSFLGDWDTLKKMDPLRAVSTLKQHAQDAAKCIEVFHREAHPSDEIHYHHTLHSVAYRLFETLQAIEQLLAQNLSRQVRFLVRPLYEMFLNFYVDWLYPEKVGPLLQAVSILKRAAPTQPEIETLRKSVTATYGRLVGVVTNAAEKGRLSPLGQVLHQQIYSSLSQVIHQDFGVTSEYGETLTGSTPTMSSEDTLEQVRWLDLITAATVSRIVDDVGALGPNPESLLEADNTDKEQARQRSQIRRAFIRYDE